jgi:deoxyguanosine kinase
MKRIIYSIEGNIGSGKSTLLKAIAKSISNVAIVPEPIESWQHVDGFNLLDKYYEDPVRWGFTFQSNCVLSRMTQLSNLISDMKEN